DLAQAKNGIDQNDINIRFYRNQLLPDVSASIDYRSTGIGGVQLSSVDAFAIASGATIPARTIVADRGFGSTLSEALQSAYPNWTFAVSVGYPLGASTAHANLARAKLQHEQAEAQ